MGGGLNMKGVRDNLNVDDIDGAVPRGLSGVTLFHFKTFTVYWSKTWYSFEQRTR